MTALEHSRDFFSFTAHPAHASPILTLQPRFHCGQATKRRRYRAQNLRSEIIIQEEHGRSPNTQRSRELRRKQNQVEGRLEHIPAAGVG